MLQANCDAQEVSVRRRARLVFDKRHLFLEDGRNQMDCGAMGSHGRVRQGRRHEGLERERETGRGGRRVGGKKSSTRKEWAP